MKKTFKRLGAMFLAMVMAVSVLCTGAFAANTAKTGPFTITIKNASADYKYEAYQIFSGDLALDEKNNKILSNIAWGSGVDSETTKETSDEDKTIAGKDLMGAIQAITLSDNSQPFSTCKTVADVVGVLSKITDKDNATTQAFAKVVGKYTTTTKTDSQRAATGDNHYADGAHYDITVQKAGYYLVKNTKIANATEGNSTNTFSSYILEVVGDVNVEPKVGVPTVKKEVQNETANEQTGKDATTASYGDTVKFTLTGTLPDNYADYTKYALTFHDTMANTLKYTENSVTVKYQKYTYVKDASDENKGTWKPEGDAVVIPEKQGTTTTANYTVNTSPEDGHTLDIAFSNVKALKDSTGKDITLGAHYQIIVTYEATVQNTAEVGSTDKNNNKVKLEYSNNPNKEDSKGNTPEDEVKVYTFQLNILKTQDDEETALPGAKFVLAKEKIDNFDSSKVNDGTYNDKLIPVTAYTESTATDDTYNYVVGGSTYTMEVSSEGKLNIKGLNEGTYYLYETEAPAGYNKLTEPVEIKITAGKTNEVVNGSVSATLTGAAKGNIDNKTDGILATVKVVNKQGSNLPSTGGMGTKLFYTIGGLLMAGAAIVLVIKKRRSSAE